MVTANHKESFPSLPAKKKKSLTFWQGCVGNARKLGKLNDGVQVMSMHCFLNLRKAARIALAAA